MLFVRVLICALPFSSITPIFHVASVNCYLNALTFVRFQNHADLYYSGLLTLYGTLCAIKPITLQLWVYGIVELLESVVMSAIAPGTVSLQYTSKYNILHNQCSGTDAYFVRIRAIYILCWTVLLVYQGT